MDSEPALQIKQEAPECPEIDLDLESVDLDLDLDLKPPQSLEIGSKNSAFVKIALPYKPLTILTNLQRGNVKTLCRDAIPPPSLSFQEKAAKGSLTDSDINESNVNSVDSDGLTALMWATFHGKLSMVELLISKNADINFPGPDGQTVLMFAAVKGHVEIITYLIKEGADVELEDDSGNTALMHAAHTNQTGSVNELLLHGASITKTNYIGDNAFEMAFSKGNRASQFAMEQHLKKILESNAIE